MPRHLLRGSWPKTGASTQPVRILRSVGTIVLLALALPGCSTEDPVVESRGAIDFIGEVAHVDFASGWTMDRTDGGGLRGGLDSDTTVGPQRIVLTNGEQLEVPAATPGAVYCAELYHPSLHVGYEVDPDLWESRCVIMGQRTDGGDVAWFQALRIERHNGSPLVDVGYVATMDTTANTLRTTDGIEFPLVAVESDCGLLPGEPAAMSALADWTSGEVVAVICLFDY